MKRLVNTLFDFFFPPFREVREARRVAEDRLFSVYRLAYDPKLGAYTALPYADDAVRVVVRANKYFGDPHAALLLAGVLEEALCTILEERALEISMGATVLVPIPLSRARARERGHNQVARVVSRLQDPILKKMVLNGVLRRHNRPSQAHIQKSERKTNIKGAFFVRPGDHARLAGRSVILVDDVCESGSTLKDARRALLESGAASVTCLALAR